METYDCIVAGVGGAGSAALYHLARRGLKVLGIDRFTPGHDRGSSHGDTRIIRMAYFEHPDYVPLLERAHQLWDQLEETRSERLRFETGLLQAPRVDSSWTGFSEAPASTAWRWKSSKPRLRRDASPASGWPTP